MIILLQERRQQRFIGFFLAALQQKMFPPEHLAGTDKENLHTNADIRTRHADRILIPCPRHDILLFRDPAHCRKLIAQPCRKLEMIGFRRGLHPCGKLPLHIFCAPLQKEQHGTDHRIIFFSVHISGTGRNAALDMIFQTGTLAHLPAASEGKQSAQELQAFMHSRHIRIRAEIACAILQNAPRHEHPRELFLQRDLHIGIALVVLEADIIAGTMLLDEVALEDERFHLRACHDGLEIRDFLHHGAHLRRMSLIALEILPHAILQHDCLAHINDFPTGILHEIHPRGIRQQLQFFLHKLRHGLTSHACAGYCRNCS